jgi:hypothetical protein
MEGKMIARIKREREKVEIIDEKSLLHISTHTCDDIEFILPAEFTVLKLSFSEIAKRCFIASLLHRAIDTIKDTAWNSQE